MPQQENTIQEQGFRINIRKKATLTGLLTVLSFFPIVGTPLSMIGISTALIGGALFKGLSAFSENEETKKRFNKLSNKSLKYGLVFASAGIPGLPLLAGACLIADAYAKKNLTNKEYSNSSLESLKSNKSNNINNGNGTELKIFAAQTPNNNKKFIQDQGTIRK